MLKQIYILFIIVNGLTILFGTSIEAIAEVKLHHFARMAPKSSEFKVKINNQNAFVYYTSAGSFVSFESDKRVDVEIESKMEIRSIVVKPLRYGIEPVIEGNKATFQLKSGAKILVGINDPIANRGEQLFIYANELVNDKPDPEAEGVHFFAGGQIYEVGELQLKDGETVYIEGGAILRGNIRATHVQNIRIAGLGVIDGSYYLNDTYHPKTILIEDSDKVTIDGIVMIEPQAWTLMLYYTEDVRIDNLKQITTGHGSDGIDIVTSRNIHISNSILSNGDDCIVIKAFQRDHQYAIPKNNTFSGVDNVQVTNCALQANLGGQAFEIGHELLQSPINNVRYVDCDVLGVHGQGGVFGMHNSDAATISNVRYENIRVDHFYNKLIDLRIIKSRWTDQEEPGHIENVVFKNIDVTLSMYNPGYSISLIGGYDEAHKVRNVTFDNFKLNGKKVTNSDQLDLFMKQTKGIVFK